MGFQILFLIVSLAVATARPQVPVVYHSGFTTTGQQVPIVYHTNFAHARQQFPIVYHGGLNTAYATPYGSAFSVQPTFYSDKTEEVTPTFKFASVVPVAPSGTEPGVPTIPVQTVEVPVGPFYNRYHAQSTDGSYSFGYFGGPSSRAEVRDTEGNVQGAFNYIDPEGKVQSQQYIADSNGFRVAGTNLPLFPVLPQRETKAIDHTYVEKTDPVNIRRKRDADPSIGSVTPYQAPASTYPIAPPANPFGFPITYATTYPFNYFPRSYNFPSTVPLVYSGYPSLNFPFPVVKSN